jgi:hypothetical protein
MLSPEATIRQTSKGGRWVSKVAWNAEQNQTINSTCCKDVIDAEALKVAVMLLVMSKDMG